MYAELLAYLLSGHEWLVHSLELSKVLGNRKMVIGLQRPLIPSQHPLSSLATSPQGAKAPLLQQGTPSFPNNTFAIHRWVSLVKDLPMRVGGFQCL